MSTAAPALPRRDVTWRDAVTPMSRASRRRWTLTYALLLMLLAADVVGDTIAPDRYLPLFVVIPAFVVFGMLRRGTRRVTAIDHPALDERDVAARDRAYRIAFPLLLLVVLGALVLLAVSVPDTQQLLRADYVPERDSGLWVKTYHLVELGLWIGLWALFLPTGCSRGASRTRSSRRPAVAACTSRCATRCSGSRWPERSRSAWSRARTSGGRSSWRSRCSAGSRGGPRASR